MNGILKSKSDIKIVRLKYGDSLWKKAITFAENCSWSAGKHIAGMLKENSFTDLEAFFAAVEADEIIGYCSFLKEDYYPENRYSPWISGVFVTENARGRRASYQMIESVIFYVKAHNFSKVYIPSDMKGFYEKCGFTPIDTLRNYGGETDTIFMREI